MYFFYINFAEGEIGRGGDWLGTIGHFLENFVSNCKTKTYLILVLNGKGYLMVRSSFLSIFLSFLTWMHVNLLLSIGCILFVSKPVKTLMFACS
jgi:hypothetical protein